MNFKLYNESSIMIIQPGNFYDMNFVVFAAVISGKISDINLLQFLSIGSSKMAFAALGLT